MSAAITEIIPASGFEQVRDAIGAALALELANQKMLQSFADPVNVFVERLVPFDVSEQVIVSVGLMKANYTEFTQLSHQGKTLYCIDVTCSGTANGTTTGSLDSGQRLHKFMGMCAYILSSPKVKALGFAPGLIGGCYLEKIEADQSEQSKDSNFVRWGRLTYAVNIYESELAFTGTALLGVDSTVSLDETDLGYKYVFNTT